MKTRILSILAAALGLAALAGLTLPITGCAGGQLTPTAGADISKMLETVAVVQQQSNTGLQTAAPSINTVLAATHNQGDAAAVNNVIAQSAAATPALQAFLAVLDAAIKANTAPAAQVAAVNAALSPATIAAIVAPTVPASSSIAQPPHDTEVAEATMYVSPLMRVDTGLRPIYGWRDAYDVRLASR